MHLTPQYEGGKGVLRRTDEDPKTPPPAPEPPLAAEVKQRLAATAAEEMGTFAETARMWEARFCPCDGQPIEKDWRCCPRCEFGFADLRKILAQWNGEGVS